MQYELKFLKEIYCDVAVNEKIFYNVVVIDTNDLIITIQKGEIITGILRDKITYINFKKNDYELILKRKKQLKEEGFL